MNTSHVVIAVGIDISKETYDACYLSEANKPAYGQFENNSKGHAKFLKWTKRLADEQPLHFCMEATGSYGYELAMYLTEHNQKISVVNPYHVHHSNLGSGIGNKTDKTDAYAIARYCNKENPPQWRMAATEMRELTALVRHLDNLQTQATQHKNRLLEPGLPSIVINSLTKLLQQVEDEIALVEKLIKQHIDGHPGLRDDRDLLVSIPGISDTTAAKILAELPDVNQFASAQSAAKYAGLSPSQYESGSSVRKRTRLFKAGNRKLKAALYMPALSAIRCNDPVRRIYKRLKDKGHKGISAIAAAMRKLLMIAVGVLRSRQKFRADYASA